MQESAIGLQGIYTPRSSLECIYWIKYGEHNVYHYYSKPTEKMEESQFIYSARQIQPAEVLKKNANELNNNASFISY